MATLEISNGTLSVAVDTLGAELASIRTADGAEWLWQGDAAWWKGRAPVLFPIVGRVANGVITVGGKPYPITIHGFARGSEFAVAETKPDTLRLRLVDSEETRKAYPFAFRLDLVFVVERGTLVNRAEVTNTGTARMPFSLGFHPGFRWPLPGGEGKQHWVTLDTPEQPPTTRLGEKLMTAPGEQPGVFSNGRFAPTANDFVGDAVILDGLRSRAATFGVEGGPEIRVTFADFPTLGIWQKPGAPYLCLEPWQGSTPLLGASEAIEDRPGIVWLEPGAMRSFTMTITPHAGG